MPDMEISDNATSTADGLTGRLRRLFQGDTPNANEPETPSDRLRDLTRGCEANQPLTGAPLRPDQNKHPSSVISTNSISYKSYDELAPEKQAEADAEGRLLNSESGQMSAAEIMAERMQDAEDQNAWDYTDDPEEREDTLAIEGFGATLETISRNIQNQREPIDPELDETYYDQPGQTPARAGTDVSPIHRKTAALTHNTTTVEQLLIELAASEGAEHVRDGSGNALLTGPDGEGLLRTAKVQAAAAEAAIQKALKDRQRANEQEDTQLDLPNVDPKAPIALKLTEEQVQLLVSNEYPNEPEKASQSVYKLIRDGEPVNILQESVQLDYSDDIKSFYARLDEAERPSLLSKLQDLEKEDERKRRAPEQQRQKSRSKDRERE